MICNIKPGDEGQYLKQNKEGELKSSPSLFYYRIIDLTILKSNDSFNDVTVEFTAGTIILSWKVFVFLNYILRF